MNMFSKTNGMSGIPLVSTGVWKIEKKRKARDEKDRSGKEKKRDREADKNESDIHPKEIKPEREDDMYCEDQTGYGLTKKKKNKCTRIDLKI